MLQSQWIRSLLVSAALLVGTVSAQVATTATVPVGPIETMGCYKDVGNLKEEGSNAFQTSGSCQVQCANLGMAVMATTQGSFCYCGSALPAEQYQADNSSCSSPCNGYGQDMCGGLGYWTVYLTGLTGQLIQTQSASSSTTAPASSSTSPSSSSTITTDTRPTQVTVTASASSTAAAHSGGTSKVGVAVGVVVGILALAALVGGSVLYFRKKRRADIEEEHRRNAAAASKQESKFDARLDAGAINARRTSIGSIADEGDFSRRILQVSKVLSLSLDIADNDVRCGILTLTATPIYRRSPVSNMYSVHRLEMGYNVP